LLNIQFEKTLKKNPVKFWWIFAFVLVALAYFFGLFIDLTGDSGLYAAISRQMVESGDWFNLKINGAAYDQKPHLFFWLAGLGIQLFGNSNFAFKLFPFIYGAAGVYFTYRLGKQLFSEEVGKWAALITGTSQIFFLYFLDNLSTCKSPKQMLGALAKTYYDRKKGIDPKNMVSVSIMPCTAKKFECNRPEMRDSGYQDVDLVITTRELGRMLRMMNVNPMQLDDRPMDAWMGEYTGAGVMFAATGGVAEAALRTLYEVVTGTQLEKLEL